MFNDAFYHLFLMGGIVLVLCLIVAATGGHLECVIVGFSGFALFLRELTQVQCKHHDNNFFRGWTWGPTGVFNLHHTVEWALPTAIWALILWAL